MCAGPQGRPSHCTARRRVRTAGPPGLPYREDGRWLCRPRSFCAKHDPSRRPPKYWHVVYDSGKPTPFVPVREAFQLEG
ncbi:lysogeny maintenance protein PflM [Pseudomonas aeruginosa]|uniref:lysogeny maintenance protein PflM n=1 Tax=Pseudomonas aeruginosa TaxID=287 RepID=UPI0039C8B6B5